MLSTWFPNSINSESSSGGLISTLKCPIILAMGFMYIFIFSTNDYFVGGDLKSLGGDKACTDLNDRFE